ncbi:MAG TPA: hypothetical protein VIP46_03420 [Pyrinomonadaceae bacterium]
MQAADVRESLSGGRRYAEADDRSFVGRLWVVTPYLLPDVNLRLRPKLWAELKPGARVVSNAFDTGDWKYEKFAHVGEQPIFFWTIRKQPPAAATKQ